jgi:type IV pilus assembly protein PilN
VSVRVNLLPHREQKRQLKKKLFYALTGVSVVAGLTLVAAVAWLLEVQTTGQQHRNNVIKSENDKLDAQIKEIASLRQEIEGLRARQRAVEDLQSNRNQPVYLLDELVRQVPEGVYLKAIKQDDRAVNMTGWATSNERVSELLRNLQNNSKYLERPELVEIKMAAQSPPGVTRRVFEFSLNFSLKPTQERADAQPGTGAQPAAAPAPAGEKK